MLKKYMAQSGNGTRPVGCLTTVPPLVCIMQAANDSSLQHEVLASGAKSGKGKKPPTTELNVIVSKLFSTENNKSKKFDETENFEFQIKKFDDYIFFETKLLTSIVWLSQSLKEKMKISSTRSSFWLFLLVQESSIDFFHDQSHFPSKVPAGFLLSKSQSIAFNYYETIQHPELGYFVLCIEILIGRNCQKLPLGFTFWFFVNIESCFSKLTVWFHPAAPQLNVFIC